jgi:hypothetical protein
VKSSVLTLLSAAIVCLAAVPSLGREQAAPVSSFRLKADATKSVPALVPAVTPAALPLFDTAIDVVAAEAEGVSREVLQLALGAIQCATASGDLDAPPTLTLIDYSRPSVEPRLWVFDLRTGELLFKELVAHGRNTGDNVATRFSDEMNSHQSSLGLFRTGDTYLGSNGYSLRLDGLEPGFNGRARDRAIVMHGAPYVDESLKASQGRIGRSWGCPALREAVARDVIDTIRGGGVIFSYYPDQAWMTKSRFLGDCQHAAPGTLAGGAGLVRPANN